MVIMNTKLKPIVHRIEDNIIALQAFQDKLENQSSEKEKMILLDYPTVYIHNWKNSDDYEVYIGESGNVIQRTKQHYAKSGNVSEWQNQLTRKPASLYIIGHEHFNKSLTLDIENRLMLYMMSTDHVKKIHNKNLSLIHI